MDRDASELYGPKANGAWGSPTALGGGDPGTADDVARSGGAGTTINRVRGFNGQAFNLADGALGDSEVWIPKFGLSTLRKGRPAPEGWFAAKVHANLVPDDAGAATANRIALQGLIDQPAFTVGKGFHLHIPPGTYYLDEPVIITRPIHMQPLGGTRTNTLVGPSVVFVMPEGKTGIIIAGNAQGYRSVNDPVGKGATVAGIEVRSTSLKPPLWANGVAKIVGDKVRHLHHNRYYYEALTAGTTGGAQPAFQGCYLIDTSITLPANGSTVFRGVIVRDLAVSTTVFWECTTEGSRGSSSSAALFTGNTTPGNTVTDGGVTWTCRSAAGHWINDNGIIWSCRHHVGIWVRTRAQIYDCTFRVFTNAGVSGNASAFPASNSNLTYLEGCNTYDCGTGYSWRGFDSNMWMLVNCNASSNGTNFAPDPLGDGGVGFWNGSFIGGQLFGCHAENSGGQDFISGVYDIEPGSDNGSGGSLFGCYSEIGALPNIFRNGTVLVGGTAPLTVDPSCDGQYTALTGTSGHNLREVQTAGKHVSAKLILGATADAVFNYLSDDDTNSLSLRQYQPGDFARPGFWGESVNFGTRAMALGLLGRLSAEGTGWNLQPAGLFEGGYSGNFADIRFKGLDKRTWHGDRVRSPETAPKQYNTWIEGDYFIPKWVNTSLFMGWLCTSAGVTGREAWTAAKQYSTSYSIEPTATFGYPGTAGGKVFKCVSVSGTGTSAGSEPDWSTATVIGNQVIDNPGANQVVWELVGFVPSWKRIGFVDDPVVARTPQARTSWRDNADTDPATAAAHVGVDAGKAEISTSATTANQIIATIPIADNTVQTLVVTIEGKIAASANVFVGEIKDKFYRNGGSTTQFGTPTAPTPDANGTLAGSTINLNPTATGVEVRVTPAVATATRWAVTWQLIELKD